MPPTEQLQISRLLYYCLLVSPHAAVAILCFGIHVPDLRRLFSAASQAAARHHNPQSYQNNTLSASAKVTSSSQACATSSSFVACAVDRVASSHLEVFTVSTVLCLFRNPPCLKDRRERQIDWLSGWVSHLRRWRWRPQLKCQRHGHAKSLAHFARAKYGVQSVHATASIDTDFRPPQA
jgi:hypothetical protein